MAFTSLVMAGTLLQNQRVIKNAVETLELQKIATSNAVHQIEIEEETRLNPELECAYDWVHDVFLFRNVGTTAAKEIFLHTAVYSVHSNEVLQLTPFRRDSGVVLPPLEKEVLSPGETANANKVYLPDKQRVAEFWKKYGGEILVRVYVQYGAAKSGYNQYSGYFNFTMDSTAQIVMQTPNEYHKFLTEEEMPSLQKTVEQFNVIPRDQFKEVAWFGGTNDMQEFPFGFGEIGVNSIVSMRSNGVFVLGSWAKLH